jgi:hypothetical protein
MLQQPPAETELTTTGRQRASTGMRKSHYAAHIHMIPGMISGPYYQEFTKANHFTGDTQLAPIHTHLPAPGMPGFLTTLTLDKQFTLSGTKLFTSFSWPYNTGTAITVTTMFAHDTQTALDNHIPKAPPTAGRGHTQLTTDLTPPFIPLGKQLNKTTRPNPTQPEQNKNTTKNPA